MPPYEKGGTPPTEASRERSREASDHQHNGFTTDSTRNYDPYADLPHPADLEADSDDGIRLLDGASFILDRPEGVPAVWGHGTDVLWAEGEAFMIAGPQGLGKTTLAGQLVNALTSDTPRNVLGLPIKHGQRVLYLAMDRPAQIARAFARVFTENDRHRLAERLTIHQGPPPYDLAKNTDVLAHMAAEARANIVITDSLKDAATGLSEDETGASYNRARQKALVEGFNLLDLHHTIKRGPNGQAVKEIADIYGSTWLTSGCGSVMLLTGEPGDPIVSMRHAKQPADEVGPYTLLHDHAAGTIEIQHGTDLVQLLTKAAARGGLTVKEAATALFDNPNPTKGQVEKARYKLNRLVTQELAIERTDAAGFKNATVYLPRTLLDENVA